MILIIVFAIIFALQQFLLLEKPIEKTGKKVFLKVRVFSSSELERSALEDIKTLYFSNQESLSTVLSIEPESSNYYLVTLEGEGIKEDNRVIFNNEKVSLNQRAKIHGLLEGEGEIIDFGERK